ncbi:MAG: type I-C CRISPR-associated protein Cas7/Csd2 [Candidatus Methanomethyliaceae archaeon]
MSKVYEDPQRRHDFVLLFDVCDGNPNGDPDAGNLPRVDPETMHGIVTDVCLKRKVRDYVQATKNDEPRYRIYVQRKGIALNTLHEEAYKHQGMEDKTRKPSRSDIEDARKYMCESFYDIRMFGAVMTTGVNCGQVRGPVQLTFGRSVDPIAPIDLSITRVAITRPEDAARVNAETGEEGEGKVTEMGRKPFVPYGLYIAKGFFTPAFAEDTGVTSDDLALFWDALQNMWELDRSASRGMMACKGLYVFTHDNKLGCAHAHELFSRIRVNRKPGVQVPRSFGDYEISVEDALPQGVTLTRLVG